MEGIDIAYYGTRWQIKSLVEKYIGNSVFEKWFENIINSPIEKLDEYINNLKVKVILQCAELLPCINNQEYKITLNKFYSKVESYVTIKEIDEKLIRYINCNSQYIWDCDDYEVIAESLKFILELNGFKGWDILINNEKCVHYLGFNHFDKVQKILKRVDKELQKKFIRKILFPFKIHAGLEEQLDIVKAIKVNYKDIAEEYETIVMAYLEGSDFIEIDSYQKQTIVKKIIESRCFDNRNEILLNTMLLKINDEVSKIISNNGKQIIISSEKYLDTIQQVDDFRDKIFLLIYEKHVSLFHLMMIERQENSIIDLISYNEGGKNKYKNSTLRNIHFIKSNIVINSMSLIKNYEEKFWKELSKLSGEVIDITGITYFLKEDIKDIRFLIDNKKYFMAGTFLTQIIERLLRELYFKLEYDVVGVLKSSNFTLKYLLEQDEDQNPLTKLFEVKELEALSFFLNDRENGENIRNNIAHYIMDSADISEMDIIFLLDILMFILLKVDYQGIEFEGISED